MIGTHRSLRKQSVGCNPQSRGAIVDNIHLVSLSLISGPQRTSVADSSLSVIQIE